MYKSKNMAQKGEFKPSKFFNLEQLKESNEFSYCLGFLWADGYIRPKTNHIVLEIQSEDEIVINKYLTKYIPWKIYYRKRKNRKNQSLLSITDKKFKDFLYFFDFDKKSFSSPNKILSFLNKDCKKFFIRGIIDGDGCIYINEKRSISQFYISSSYDQDWEYLEKIFANLDIKYSINRTITSSLNKYSAIRITNKAGIKKLVNFLYKDSSDSNLGLDRKTSKLLKFIE